MNKLDLSSTVSEIQPLRYTPAGLPALEMLLSHVSEVPEAGQLRKVELNIPAVALGDVALLLADTSLGSQLAVQGFLAPARKGAGKLVLHIQQARRMSPGTDPATV